MAQYIARDSHGWIRVQGKSTLTLYLYQYEDAIPVFEFEHSDVLQEFVKRPKGWPDLKVGQIVRIKEVITVDGKVETPKPRRENG